MEMITTNLTPRQQAFLALCEECGIEVGDASTTAGEDTADYFGWRSDDTDVAPEKEVERFCLRTESGEFTYLYPDHDSLDSAKTHSVENIVDGIYPEFPVEIVDLDTNDRIFPKNIVWSA